MSVWICEVNFIGGIYMAKVKMVDVEDKYPVCPYCNKDMETIERIKTGVLSSTAIYICPHCRKLLKIQVYG